MSATTKRGKVLLGKKLARHAAKDAKRHARRAAVRKIAAEKAEAERLEVLRAAQELADKYAAELLAERAAASP